MAAPDELLKDESAQGRIIVVEDDSDFRESLVETLSLYGYEVIGAKSALDFYQKVALKPCSLAILDLGLPDQSGVVLAEFIRQNTRMRIVVLTARSAIESRVAAYKAGADTYLLKPVDTSELIATVESNLGRLCPRAEEASDPAVHHLEPLSPSWQLHRSKAILTAPTGEKISLSSREVDIMEFLVSNPEQHATRKQLMVVLGYDGSRSGSQTLDVVIHRLRQKAVESGVRLPIKTVRGKGYSVSESLILQEGSAV